jgi:hypothetical protein
MSEGSYDGLLVSAGIECLNPGFFGFRPSMKASMNLTGFLCLSTGRWYWEIALFGLCGFRLRVRSWLFNCSKASFKLNGKWLAQKKDFSHSLNTVQSRPTHC